MKNKMIIKMAILLSLSLVGFYASFQGQRPAQELLNRKELESYLKKASVVSVEIDSGAGRMAAWRIRLDDGKVARQAIFKYIDRRRPEVSPASYKYELAAYELDKLLDLERIPPLIEKKIRDKSGSLQLFMDGCINENGRRRKKLEPPDSKAFADALEEINVFENLTYCERTDLNDILIHTADWRVCRVDFSEAFAPKPKLIPETAINRCSKKVFQNLLKLDEKVVRDKLSPYLNNDEIKTLLERKKLIIEQIDKAVKERGEDAIIFS